VLAADETSVAAALYAQRSGCRWATIAVLPLNLAGAEGPPSGLGLAPGRGPFGHARDGILRSLVPLLMRPLAAPLADAREAVGLPPSSLTIDRIVFSPQLILASGVGALDYGREGRPGHLHFVGRLTAPDARSAQTNTVPEWWGDLEGRTVVHVTQGTQNTDPDDLIRPSLAALADRDVLVVVTTGVSRTHRTPLSLACERARRRLDAAQPAPAPHTHRDHQRRLGRDARRARARHPARHRRGRPRQARSRRPRRVGGSRREYADGTSDAVRRAFDRTQADAAYRAAARSIADQLATAGGAPRAAQHLEDLAAR